MAKEIFNQEDLEAIKSDLNGEFVLMEDIDLNDNWQCIGSETAPFTGVLNGNGYCVSSEGQPLFNILGMQGSIIDLMSDRGLD